MENIAPYPIFFKTTFLTQFLNAILANYTNTVLLYDVYYRKNALCLKFDKISELYYSITNFSRRLFSFKGKKPDYCSD